MDFHLTAVAATAVAATTTTTTTTTTPTTINGNEETAEKYNQTHFSFSKNKIRQKMYNKSDFEDLRISKNHLEARLNEQR